LTILAQYPKVYITLWWESSWTYTVGVRYVVHTGE